MMRTSAPYGIARFTWKDCRHDGQTKVMSVRRRDILLLAALGAAAEQDDHAVAIAPEVDSVSPPIDPVFQNTSANPFDA